MNKLIIILLITLALSACGGSSSDEQTTTPTPDIVEPTLPQVDDYQLEATTTLLDNAEALLQGLSIDDFYDQAFTLISERNIENLIADGRFDQVAAQALQLENISDEYSIQTGQLYERILALLLTYNKDDLTFKQQVSFDVFKKDLESKIEWIAYVDFNYPATYGFFGWPGSTETFFTQAFTVNNKAQADVYLTLLNQIGRRFAQIEVLLDTRKAKGIVEPAWTLGYSQGLVAAMGNSAPESTSYYQALNDQITALSTINDAEKQTLRATLLKTVKDRVLPAYSSLANKMNGLLSQAPANIGFGQFEGGDAFYDFTLRYYTSSNLTAQQVYDLGLQELDRIHNEMRVMFDQLGYPQDESLAALYTRVNSDAELILASEAKAVYEEIIAQAYLELPNLFEVLPQQEVIVVGGESGGYYISGSDDGSRPGAFYANTVDNMPYTTMPTLAYHEAVPGHHLQIALANELDLPLFRQKSHVTSFIEGWGLYAERLAKDSGWYAQSPYADLGRLQFEAMRAARLVVDTGIHSKGWSNNFADQFHIENVGFSGSISRYSVWPGQATAYMTGMLKILELRQMAIDELGDLYDIKEFHTAVIGNGSVPLDVLQTVVEQYIVDKLNPE
ncbi:MAG: DUF885 domain-containing protein [Colwellia sp.]|nr:DUF885 domain-containing protein [Colwellia sp.]MCW8866060.1 DUF885 domain-containing protein [Colwellia sp.]MCW9081240.1 DUF885 domain-containing protein [Colwellia sp.]